MPKKAEQAHSTLPLAPAQQPGDRVVVGWNISINFKVHVPAQGNYERWLGFPTRFRNPLPLLIGGFLSIKCLYVYVLCGCCS